MERPDIDAQIAKLRLTWRRVTREWLIARRDVAELQDRTLVDLRSAVAAAQRLEHTERYRADVARQLQALYDRLEPEYLPGRTSKDHRPTNPYYIRS